MVPTGNPVSTIRRPSGTPRGAVAVIGWLVLLAMIAQAQDVPELPPGIPPVDTAPVPPAPQPQRSDVYINDSFEASDALAKARGLSQRGRWREAAELLQGASDNLGDKLVRFEGGFVSVRRRIADVICAWPPTGLDEYRATYDRELEAALSAQRDSRSVDDLLPLLERYFCTTGGLALADRIGQLAIESGDLPLADYVYRRVIELHPDARPMIPRLNAMRTLIGALRGESAAAPPDELAQVRIRWRGQDMPLHEVLTEVGTGYPMLRGAETPNDWPIFAGNAERNRETTTRVDEPGLLWRHAFADKPAEDRRSGIVEALVQSGRDESRGLTIFPIVADGLVFAQRYREVTALHRNSGTVAWRFGGGEPKDDGVGYLEDRPPGWNSPTVEQGRLFATLPADDTSFYNYDSGRDVHELVCLDASSGRLIWRVTQKGVDVQGTATAFDSSPIVRHGRVYIVSRRRRSFGFEDSYLDGYRATDGRLLFRTHLGSASTSSLGLRGATNAIIAARGDSVFVCTNLGSIAAVSAYTGAVQWLRMYERFRSDGSRPSGWASRDLSPWCFNPVFLSKERLVALPTDGARLLVLSTNEGRIERSIPLEEIGGLQSVYGLRGDLLCGAGDAVVCYDLAAGTLKWSKELPEGSPMFGRGEWVGDELLVPRRDGLSRFRIEDGTRTDVSLGSEAKGGNLVALPDQLFVAGTDELLGYARKSEIWKNLRERMAAAPDDPLPALEFAEVALGAGELSESLSVFDEAVRRISPSLSAGAPPIRDRVLTDVLKIVDTLVRRSDVDRAVLDRLYGYACESAGGPESAIAYRFRFAEVFAGAEQPERAVRLYQQVLRDRTLRAMPTGAQASASQRAGARAQARIGELIGRHGRSVYAEFEQEAAQRLEAARSLADTAQLLEIVESFPNSGAAPKALIACGEWYVLARRPEEAARRFSQALNRYGDKVDRPALIRLIADAYIEAGKPEHAYLWLTKAIREFPAATVDVNGRRLSFAQYRDRLGDVRTKVEPSRARLTLPLERTYTVDLQANARLLLPAFASDPAARWAYFYIHASDGIRAYQAATGKPRWPDPAPVRMNPELLIALDDVAVLATPFEVFGLDAAGGARRWSSGEYPARLADPGADWEDGAAFRTHAVYGDRLVSVRDDGRLTCINMKTGALLWSGTRRPAPLGKVRMSDSLVAYHIVQDGVVVLCLIDAATGEWIDAVTTEERRPVEDLFLTLDRQIIVVTSQSIACYDAETSSRRWQSALNWPLRSASLAIDMDALYFVDDDGDLRKLSLEDGRLLWESDRVILRNEDDVTMQREGGYLFVTSATSVSAIDSTTGLLLWQGTTPEKPKFVARLLTTAYLIAANMPGEPRDGANTAYFYDHRNASGVIPRNGGALELGKLGDVRAWLAADGALIIQDGPAIHGFSHP